MNYFLSKKLDELFSLKKNLMNYFLLLLTSLAQNPGPGAHIDLSQKKDPGEELVPRQAIDSGVSRLSLSLASGRPISKKKGSQHPEKCRVVSWRQAYTYNNRQQRMAWHSTSVQNGMAIHWNYSDRHIQGHPYNPCTPVGRSASDEPCPLRYIQALYKSAPHTHCGL